MNILEIAVFDFESALIAAASGADRIELCDDYNTGGVTVKHDILKKVRDAVYIPVFPIIRPRVGDFVYNEKEFEQIQEDVLLCKQLGFEGVVVGFLNEDNSIDVDKTQVIVEMVPSLAVTFHRAFDACTNPLKSLEQIIQCGCKRILTSGQQPSAIEGISLIERLVEKAKNRIIIMPGGGVRSNNIHSLLATQAKEFHSAALSNINHQLQINPSEIAALKAALKNVN